nr:ribonuclease hi [Quercus suber]
MVYTMVFSVDGACRGNGRPGSQAAAAAVLLTRSGTHKAWTRTLPDDPTPTNQRAELTAIILALELALERYRDLDSNPYIDVVIKSDSKYAVNCMNMWINKWRNNGWTNAAGNDVANTDLLRDALDLDIALQSEGSLSYKWIPRERNELAHGYWRTAGIFTTSGRLELLTVSVFGFARPAVSASSFKSSHVGRGISIPVSTRVIDKTPLLIHSILPRPEADAFDDRQDPGFLPRRRPALEFLRLDQLALDAEHRLLDPAGLDHLARRRRQPGQRPLADAVRRVDAGHVHGLEEVLRDHVDDALAALDEVAQAVLGAVERARDPDDEQRRLVAHQLRVAERRQVRRRAVRRARAEEADGPRHDRRDEQLVVQPGRPAGLVRVNVDVRVLGGGGGAVAGLPAWVHRLRVVPA